jgi:hypothetical protein
MYRIIPGKELPKEFKIEINGYNIYCHIINYLSSKGYVKRFAKTVDFSSYLHITESKSICEFDSGKSFIYSKLPEIRFEDYFEPIQGETSIASKLKELLENMTQEEFDKAWEEIKNLKLKGPTIEEYLNSK